MNESTVAVCIDHPRGAPPHTNELLVCADHHFGHLLVRHALSPIWPEEMEDGLARAVPHDEWETWWNARESAYLKAHGISEDAHA